MKRLIWVNRGILIFLWAGLFLFGVAGCKKSSDSDTPASASVPVLSTTAPTGITSTTVSGGGTITSDGGASVSAHGVCWSTSQDPAVAGNKTSDGAGTGSFTSNLQGLSPATPYYVRAYATNSAGTGYGNTLIFTTLAVDPGSIVDFDGNVYHPVTIGTQVWLVEPLKATHYRNGDPITHTKDKWQLKNQSTDGQYWNYSNNDSLGKIFGRLYNYYAVVDPRFIAPLGWHVASDSDWATLASYLGADSIVGGKLKEAPIPEQPTQVVLPPCREAHGTRLPEYSGSSARQDHSGQAPPPGHTMRWAAASGTTMGPYTGEKATR